MLLSACGEDLDGRAEADDAGEVGDVPADDADDDADDEVYSSFAAREGQGPCDGAAELKLLKRYVDREPSITVENGSQHSESEK